MFSMTTPPSFLAKFFANYRLHLYHLRYIRKSPWVLPRIILGVMRTNLLGQKRVRVVELAVNYACNGNCIFCSCSKLLNQEKEKKLFTPADYRKIGKELDELGTIGIVITGGEPLLRPDLEEIILGLNPRNKIISVVTNALLATRKRIFSLKDAGLNAIEFSLESEKPEVNDQIRGYRGHYQKVMKAIGFAKEAGLNVCLSPCLSHDNIREFINFIKLAQKLDTSILLSLAGNVGRWSEHDEFLLDEDDWQLMEEYKLQFPFIRNDFDTNYYLRPGCPAGREKFYLSPYGDVIPCSFVHLSFGNLKEEPLEKIWQRMNDFPLFKEYYPYCRRTKQKEYNRKYLDQIKDLPHLPVFIKDLKAWKRG